MPLSWHSQVKHRIQISLSNWYFLCMSRCHSLRRLRLFFYSNSSCCCWICTSTEPKRLFSTTSRCLSWLNLRRRSLYWFFFPDIQLRSYHLSIPETQDAYRSTFDIRHLSKFFYNLKFAFIICIKPIFHNIYVFKF